MCKSCLSNPVFKNHTVGVQAALFVKQGNKGLLLF